MTQAETTPLRRRDLLSLIGAAAGSSALYFAMSRLGHAQGSDYAGPINLSGDPKGASVLILGAGVAGMVAALELRRAGYRVQVLEYNDRVGGRTWTIRGGDRFTELGGATQDCGFDRGLYFNPGPWRIPYHHRALLDYCKRLGVTLEPFTQVNANAYLHGKDAFGGQPQRYRTIQADFNGMVSELLAKAVNTDRLNALVSKEDTEVLLEALQDWGALDDSYAYKAGEDASERRGWRKPPGGGLSAEPIDSTPLRPQDLLQSHLWRRLSSGLDYDYQTTLFQPVGGMDKIAEGFAREVGDLVRLNARVTAIRQDEHGVQVTWEDKGSQTMQQSRADWCLCTIPLSVLSQIEMNVGAPMAAAVAAVPYSPSVKIGLQFKRRFWETDEAIYGGISYTDLPITMIGYPATGYFDSGKGVLLGTYAFGPYAYEFESLSPAERIAKAVAFGAQIHPQYPAEFDNGMAVAWHRVPSQLGCYGQWTDATRAEHYRNLCAIDGRILLAGEHASYIPAWQEGAILSSLDAITRLHERVMKS
ncbi:NAD(P)/FAD-dependent oxidoreductase [Acidisoma cellulosilytica]|uniref:Tryptophan 2-monooxygenase n=1 Tax=Acidisoma cellulosilyticum TaxID=2802395 RepID=A0A963Z5B2_9PROT|nr:NAD(P)/FAD-dependent oxidoreductase [Acidisoma cellulosilyticum]MCB8882102.1 NAD(P)/FAD-dependent oxidoreductase [Acidisoma cellulosilyticum]